MMTAGKRSNQETGSQIAGTALKKTTRMFLGVLPILAAMLLLIGLAVTLLPQRVSATLFQGAPLRDAITGAGLGSIATGMPVISYVLGKGLLDAGAGLIAATALMLSWVTVGMVQLPAESLLLGRRFALLRNLSSFLLAVGIALAVTWTLQVLS